ncbi:MAG: phage holin family protein [Gemmatimonadetes bacterium]|nr:phage holin family protein [Gemmatimonadota bacterium]
MSDVDDRSFGTMIREIGGNVDRIIRTELRIAFAEVRSALRAAARPMLLLATAAFLAAVALLFLLGSAMLALATVMPAWAAALVVSFVTALASLLVLALGRAQAGAVLSTTDLALDGAAPQGL